jgi:hypothetical protein
MKRFIFNHSIDQEIIEKFISLVESANPDEKIVIYLTSGGGSETGMYIIIDIINSNPERFEIYAMEKIFSAAFELFFHVKCNKRIAPATVGMCHLAGSEMRMLSSGEPYYNEDKEVLKAGKIRTLGLQALLSEIGVLQNDVDEILKGEDVYFQYDQIQAFIANQQADNSALCLQEPPKEGV